MTSLVEYKVTQEVSVKEDASENYSGPGPPTENTNPNFNILYLTTKKTQNSLKNSSHHTVNIATAVAKFLPEDFANQITLIDLPLFVNIRREELISCAWNKKNKSSVAPNVVGFTKRFNYITFWTVQEILVEGSTAKQRSEILAYFIRIAKRLYDLNNLHSLFAIISALQSAPIYRLSRTWSCLSKKERQVFNKLAEIYSDENNWCNLRSHMKKIKLPCIPYLGLYLTDLIYIDMAFPQSRHLKTTQRAQKMNNILETIQRYQQSDYSQLSKNDIIQKYLNSVRYIEELQKFVEDDQYKLSLKLEPLANTSISSNTLSKESLTVDSNALKAMATLNLSPARYSTGSLRIHTSGNKFSYGHRKSHSLGSNIFNKSQNEAKNFSTNINLLDDSELDPTLNLEETPIRKDPSLQSSDTVAENISLLSREEHISLKDQICVMQGCVQRKTLLKGGRKPIISSWHRYWIQIWSNFLVYFAPKSLKGHQRSDFKTEPCKFITLTGYKIVLGDDIILQPNCFQIIDHFKGNIYKFRVGTKNLAERWYLFLQQAASEEPNSFNSNLISFE